MSQPTDNELLAEILAAVEALGSPPYTVAGDDSVSVDDTLTEIRAANPDAIKTLITNTGAQIINIFEGAQLVATLYTDETYISDLGGSLQFTGICGTGLNTTVAVTTYTPA